MGLPMQVQVPMATLVIPALPVLAGWLLQIRKPVPIFTRSFVLLVRDQSVYTFKSTRASLVLFDKAWMKIKVFCIEAGLLKERSDAFYPENIRMSASKL